MKPSTLSSLVSLAAACAAAVAASAAAPDHPTFPGGTASVVLDVVVRDGDGRVARDLQASDFEVFEDGVKQTIESFQVVSRADGPSPMLAGPGLVGAAQPSSQTAAGTGAMSQAAPGPAVVALVFDRLSSGTRDFARRAGLAYVSEVHRSGDVAGVFAIDLSPRIVLPFTDDPQRIRAGIEQAVRQAQSAGNAQDARAEQRQRNEELALLEQSVEQLMPSAARSASAVGELKTRIAIARRSINQENAALALDQERQGYGATLGLTAIVRALDAVGGRKTLVLFSDGLSLPGSSQSAFRSVIDAANRANVSIYAVDTSGLRALSSVGEAREELNRSISLRSRQFMTGGDDAAEGSLTRALERNEDVLRSGPASTLGPLASETGGLLISDTNDVASRFRTMADDMRFHYVVSYSPVNETDDGRFRRLSVRAKRKGLEVRTRRGYLARHPETAPPPAEGDAPVARALQQSPPPDAFPLFVEALSFPEAARPGLVPVFVELPADALTYAPDTDGRLRAEVSLLLRVRDGAGRPHASLHQSCRPPRPDPGQPGPQGVLFQRELVLPPGQYVLEVAAHDALSDRASVRLRSFTVPEPNDEGLRLSSLVLARGVRPIGPQEDSGHGPLVFGQALLQPNLGEPVHKSTTPSLGFFFVAYNREPDQLSEATVELWRGTARVGRHPLRLEAPNEEGEVRQAGLLPLHSLTPGSYTLRVAVADGSHSAQSETAFTLAE